MSIPQCIILEIPYTLSTWFWLSTSGNSSAKFFCGNAVNMPYWNSIYFSLWVLPKTKTCLSALRLDPHTNRCWLMIRPCMVWKLDGYQANSLRFVLRSRNVMWAGTNIFKRISHNPCRHWLKSVMSCLSMSEEEITPKAVYK